MPVLKVLEFPDPVLKKVSQKVIIFDLVLESLVNDLIETLGSHKYCVGIAAPQVGNLQRIVVIDVSRARKPVPNNGLLILINPVILDTSNLKIVREGCLSIPDFTANVKRAMNITIAYQSLDGTTTTLTTKDFEAHAIQHEIDHLDGVLFLDRITNPASDLFRRVKY